MKIIINYTISICIELSRTINNKSINVSNLQIELYDLF